MHIFFLTVTVNRSSCSHVDELILLKLDKLSKDVVIIDGQKNQRSLTCKFMKAHALACDKESNYNTFDFTYIFYFGVQLEEIIA